MQALSDHVAGHHRATTAHPWAVANYRVGPEGFEIRPGDPSSATVVPVCRWPLREVVAVNELEPPLNGRTVIELRFVEGAGIQASVPESFVAELLAALHTAVGAADTGTVPAVPSAAVPPPYRPVPAPVVVGAAGVTTATERASQRPADTDAASGAGRRPRRWVIALGGVVLLALAISAVALWVRADAADERAAEARATLAERDAALTSTRAELEDTERQLETTQTEVEDLTTRVSELSNEKAQVQDERNAAQEVNELGADAASKLLECRDLVLTAMDYVLDEYYYSAADALDAAVSVCNAADDAVAAFGAAL